MFKIVRKFSYLPYNLPVLSRCCSSHSNRTTNQPAPNFSHSGWIKPEGYDTEFRIYNTVARRKVQLIVPHENCANWYTCGPTVYDSTHLGHASCYVKLDIIQRLLRAYGGINLVTAMNITDIDDKIIERSQREGIPWQELSQHYEKEFWQDLKSLGVLQPNLKLRVSEQLPKIQKFIEGIMAREQSAYVGKDKSVYFSVQKYPLYGKLQNISKSEPPEQQNLENKHAAEDFALWKSQKTESEPAWESAWGAGRPGWHIECSALASMLFGERLDFHAGGLDLRFPHHENEEAQSCVFHNTRQWVNYWLHTGQLNIKGDSIKMSKSLGNTVGIPQMLANYSADEFRMACIVSNYRNSLEYGDDLMTNARNTLNKFKYFQQDCQAYFQGMKPANDLDSTSILNNLNHNKNQIVEAIRDDFDTGRCISILMDQISSVSRCINSNNKQSLQSGSCFDVIAAVGNFVDNTLQNMGFNFVQPMHDTQNANDLNLNELIEDVLQTRKYVREMAGSSKNKVLFKICDDLRDLLKRNGVEIKDHATGSSWSFKQ